MQLFMATLCTFAALAYAKPQGYNYGSGISGGFGNSGFVAAPSTSTGSFSTGGGGFSGFGGLGGLGGGSGYSSGGVAFTPSASGYNTGGGSFGQSAAFEAPLVHKQFITVSAPEDHENLEQSKHFVIGRPQKNYRVVFIKAPSSSNANVRLSAEYAPKEEKTVIYVLTKKDAALEVNDIATPAPTVPSKPEVFFIKYKTEEEAAHAQKQIQSEYDKIEGTSEHTDGGVAPQKSVIGILGGGGPGVTGASSPIGISGFASQGPSSFLASGSATKPATYLPPANRV